VYIYIGQTEDLELEIGVSGGRQIVGDVFYTVTRRKKVIFVATHKNAKVERGISANQVAEHE
jgi:hypothetical protein